MLPEGSKLVSVDVDPNDMTMVAMVEGLTLDDSKALEKELLNTLGIELEVRGQLSLFG